MPRDLFTGHRDLGVARTRDNLLTYDHVQTRDAAGNHLGKALGGRFRTHDGRTVDSTGAFLVGELERLEQKLHAPLAAVSWSRDIDLREDVTIADEATSYTVSQFAAAGGLGTGQGIGNGKAWIGKASTQISRVSVDIGKVPHALTPWGQELAYTILELESAAKLGRPVDEQKFDALKLKHQMDVDEQVYFGDTSLGVTGIINADTRSGLDQVTNVTNVPAGAGGYTQWAHKSPDEILADFNAALVSAWATAAWAVVPTDVRIPPAQYGYIATAKVSNAGNVSIKKYVEENNLLAQEGARDLRILPLKWLIGAGVGGTIGVTGTVDRMMVYTKDKDYVRFPMTMLSTTPLQYDSIYHKKTYFGRLGVAEIVYPQTVGYSDGI